MKVTGDIVRRALTSRISHRIMYIEGMVRGHKFLKTHTAIGEQI
jgi:hypothetical protein